MAKVLCRVLCGGKGAVQGAVQTAVAKSGNGAVQGALGTRSSNQINSLTTRANKTLGLLRRNLKSCSPYTTNIVYKTSVRPQLEHCSPIWDPYEKGHILSLEKVQRRAVRFVSGRLPLRVRREGHD